MTQISYDTREIFLHQNLKQGKHPWWKSNNHQILFQQVDLSSLERQINVFKSAANKAYTDLKHSDSLYIRTLALMERCGALPPSILERVARVYASVDELCDEKGKKARSDFVASQLKANAHRDRYITRWFRIYNEQFDDI